MWITWYGGGFDVPFLNTRLLNWGFKPLPPVPHIDGWRIAKFKMKLNSNRLASVSDFLGVESKTKLDPPTWVRAAGGHKPSIKYIEEHCRQDVIVLEDVYEKIRPLMTTGPNLAMLDTSAAGHVTNGCPICKSQRVQKRGFRIARTTRYQRFQCQDCGGWSSGRPDKIRGVEVR